MPKEIELKLRLNPAQARRLAGHPVFSGMQPQKYKLFNTYYDTPDLALCRRGIARARPLLQEYRQRACGASGFVCGRRRGVTAG